MRSAWFIVGLLIASGVQAQAAEPDTTAAEPLRRPRPTASAPT